MSSKLRSLLVLLGICIVLGTALLLITRPWTSPSDELLTHTHDHDEDAELLGGTLIKREADDVESMVLENEHGRFTIKRNSSTQLLEIEELSNSVPQYDSFLEYIWYYGYDLSYNYEISQEYGAVSASDYGLDKPTARVTVKFFDGTSECFTCGGEVPGDDEDVHYMTFGDRKSVYAADMHPAIFQGGTYFVNTDFFGNERNDEEVKIGKITITGSEIKKDIVIEPSVTKDRSAQSFGSEYIITAPVKDCVDNENMTSLVNELTYLTADDVVCVSPGKEQKEKYGLRKPRAKITFDRSGVEWNINCGSVGDSVFYFTVDGIDAIYSVSTDEAPILSELSLSALRRAELRVYSIDAVESLELKADGETYSFSCVRSSLTEDELSGYYAYHAFCGERELTLSYYKNFLAVLSGATANSRSTEKSASKPEVVITVSYFDSFGRENDVIELYEAPSRRYQYCLNGSMRGQVTSSWVKALKKAAKSLAAGEVVES